MQLKKTILKSKTRIHVINYRTLPKGNIFTRVMHLIQNMILTLTLMTHDVSILDGKYSNANVLLKSLI